MSTATVTPEVSEVVFSLPPGTQYFAPEPAEQEEFDLLVERAREFGTKYGAPYLKAESTFSKAFAENVDDFLCLREMFPKKGSHATRTVAGQEYTWKSFCTTFLYITPEYFGQLVRRLRPDPNKPTPEPRPVEDTPAYRAGFRAGQEMAIAELEEMDDSQPEKLVTETAEVEDRVSTAAETPEPTLTDTVSYFANYKKDPAKFAEELRALVQHFGLACKISVELI
jgi:hypothetical protein